VAGDAQIFKSMELARKMVEYGLALRAENKLKIRQPLHEFKMNAEHLSHELLQIMADELNVKKVSFTEFVAEDKQWANKEEGSVKVWLNITVDEELKKEGLVREIVRTINQMRKEQKLTIKDIVSLRYNTDDELLLSAFKDYEKEIKHSVLAKDLQLDKNLTSGEVILDDKKIYLSLMV
jgi:isoleucyl-tRNA synthetase